MAYTKQPAGRLQRLSVAVLIDNLRTTDADGKVTETPLTEDQLGRINTLVRDAVGFDDKRGDRVSVVNQSFLPETPVEEQEIASTPFWEKPILRDVAKIVSGLVVLVLLLLFVIRPLMRSLSSMVKAVMTAPPPALPSAGGAATAGALVPPGGRPGNAMAYEQQIAQARSIVAKDPVRVAQVVKDWVQKDE